MEKSDELIEAVEVEADAQEDLEEEIRQGRKLPPLKATAKLIIFNPESDNRLAFGPGVASICKGVREYGSLQAAAKQMGMSYTKAWKIIGEAEEAMGIKLVERQKPKGFWLTPAGNKLLDGFLEISENVAKYTDFLLCEYMKRS